MDIFISILALVGFVALTATTGLFVAVEFSLTGLEHSTVDNHVKAVGDRKARTVGGAFKHLSFVLSGAQLGITLTTLATGYLAEPVLAKFFQPLLEFVGLPAEFSSALALILALVIATILSMVFGELVPKNWAITSPLTMARRVVGPVQAFNKAFKWFINFLNVSANWVVRRLGIEPADELASARSPQELSALVRNSVGEDIDEAMAEVLENSLEFGDATAAELMTPRSTVDTLQADQTVWDLIELARTTGHSRFPVVDADLDQTLGVVHIKDAFDMGRDQRTTTFLGPMARPIPTIPESLDGDAVLKAVRSAGSQLVLVADEYGGTSGIVTIEDVVEEILGEVYDEHDDAADRDVQRFGDSWEVSGLVRVEDLEEEMGYCPPEDGPYETLGGLVMHTMRRIPAVGDAAALPQGPAHLLETAGPNSGGTWVARISAMDGRRIDRVVLTPMSTEEAEAYL